MKKIFTIFLCIGLAVSLCGCNIPVTDIKSLLHPPKLGGEIPEIETALRSFVNEEITFENPTSGEHRSAYVLYDIDGDYLDEAFVFYKSLGRDKSNTEIHMNFIKKGKKGYKSVNDVILDGNTVDNVSFYDINSDGKKGIFVSLATFGETRKTLEIFRILNKNIRQCFKEKHSVYSVLDINSDSEKEVVTLSLNSAEKTSIAAAYKVEDKSYECISTCPIDGNVVSYSNIIQSKLKNGLPAIFVDAQKSSDMIITEILYWNKGLVAPLYDSVSGENHITLRSKHFASTDIDNDSSVEIPFTENARGVAADSNVFAVHWRGFDALSFSTATVTLYNYSAGYSVTIPNEYLKQTNGKSVYFENNPSENICILYSTDSKKKKDTEVLRIKCFGSSVWQYSSEGYEEIITSEDIVYAVKFNTEKLSVSQIKENFALLN